MQIDPPTDSVIAIPPLVQCVDDALRWFGETEVSAYQVTASMPEWSPATAGWLIAKLFEAALSLDPAPQHLAVRATRTDA